MGIIPINISRKQPDWYSGKSLPELAPDYIMIKNMKDDKKRSEGIRDYTNCILKQLDKEDILGRIEYLSKGKDVALICWEKTGQFCHRYLVADWLDEGIEELQFHTTTNNIARDYERNGRLIIKAFRDGVRDGMSKM